MHYSTADNIAMYKSVLLLSFFVIFSCFLFFLRFIITAMSAAELLVEAHILFGNLLSRKCKFVFFTF